MKTVAIAILMLLVGANALPTLTEDELRQERLISDIIVGLINDLSQRIRDAGLDPFEVSDLAGEFALSEPEVLTVSGYVSKFYFSGLSNIAVNSIDFSLLQSRLTFDLSLPRLAVLIDNAGFDLVLMGRELYGQASGSLEITQPRLSGDVRVSIGAISGISVRSLNLSFSLGGINSDLNINLVGRDVSDIVNEYLNSTLPKALDENQKAINDLVEYIAWIIIERIL